MLITLVGKKRHGKDTVADYFSNTYGYTKYALANPIKCHLMEEFGFTADQVNGINFDREKYLGIPGSAVSNRFKKILNKLEYYASVPNIDWTFIEEDNNWSVRKLLQILGTEIGVVQVDKLIWMHPMVERYNNGENLIISDCRQEHEINLCRKFGSKVIHIINPFIINDDTHITERGLPILDGDFVIENNYDPLKESYDYNILSLNTLYNKIDEVMSGFIKKDTTS
jgi:hypothetical protein